MEPDNVLQFPFPDHDMSSEESVAELTRLSSELASTISDDEEGYAECLARIEKASILLQHINLLVTRGRDRRRAMAAFERVTRLLAELRSKLRQEA